MADAPVPPALAQFFTACSNAAAKLGIKTVVIGARDPASGETRVVTTPDGVNDLRQAVADKFGLSDMGETGWD